MQAITKASNKAIPRRKIRLKQHPPWWTKDLDVQRKKMRAAYRKINYYPEERQLHRNNYNAERNSLVKLLRKEKRTSWRRFAGEIRDDKWGRCFRWIK